MNKRLLVYEAVSDDCHQWLAYAPSEDLSAASKWFKGQPVEDSWRPQAVFYGDEPGARRPRPDMSCLGSGIPVFTRAAAESLRDILEPHGELLPLAYAADFRPRRGRGWVRTSPQALDEPVFAFNVTNVVDVLDAERSDIVRFGDGRIMVIRRPAFRSEGLRGQIIFKVPQWPVSTYVTSHFVRRATDANLKGLDFTKPVWCGDAQE